MNAKSSLQHSNTYLGEEKKMATFPIHFFRGITKVWEGGGHPPPPPAPDRVKGQEEPRTNGPTLTKIINKWTKHPLKAPFLCYISLLCVCMGAVSREQMHLLSGWYVTTGGTFALDPPTRYVTTGGTFARGALDPPPPRYQRSILFSRVI